MNGSIIVVAHVRDDALRPKVGERLADLESFYLPLGIVDQEHAWHPGTGIVAERIACAKPRDHAWLWTWGEALPDELATADAVLDALPDELRAIQGMTTAFAFGRDRARIVSAPSGPATLYEAEGDGIWCCSTHAVAAAWVAFGDAGIDPDSVPEMIAFDFVGGERTLIAGVRALPPATTIAISRHGHSVSTWLSPAERWAPVPEEEAHAEAERALLASVAARLAGREVSVALTAGLDSRVLAVALAEADVPFDAFTWGAPGWPDTEGAAQVAQLLGAPHAILGQTALPADEVLAEHDRAVRWADGVFALAPAARTWPPGADAVASGMGGETGRAFYYDDWSAWLWPDPPRNVLADRLAGRAHLPAATLDAAAQADAAVGAWLDAAEQTGAKGWRLLDVAYADQRVRRWGRGQVPCVGCALAPAFTPQDLARALVSQPLRERLASGFHHRFLDGRRLELAPYRNEAPSMPPPWLRRGHRLRQSNTRARALGRRPLRQPGDEFVARLWAERPQALSWVLDHVLVHPLTGGRLGQAWVEWAREGFPRGARRAGEHARLAAGVVALDDALAALRHSRRSSAP